MVKSALIFLLVCAAYLHGNAQERDSNFVRQGLIRANLTISPGFLFEKKAETIYLHGDLEYFVEKNISVKGDFYLFLDDQEEEPFLRSNHSVFLGATYNFLDHRVSPFVGLQPGLNITQIETMENNGIRVSKKELSPVVSVISGLNFYFHKYFNFYFALRYIQGRFFSDLLEPISLNEIRFSAGLGFNLSKEK